jgi:hypothetical protein
VPPQRRQRLSRSPSLAAPSVMFSCLRQRGIFKALTEVEKLMTKAFIAAGAIEVGSDLDQATLKDGGDIVRDYLKHGEEGCALEHLIYMVREPSLPISPDTYESIRREAEAMKIDPSKYEDIRP